jgi:macrolide-specific efflux system membrane fusion protein
MKLRMTNYECRMLVILLIGIMFAMSSCAGGKKEELKTVKVTRGSIRAQIPSTGIIQPRNRLEIKPPIAGRVDEVLVSEGQGVKKGQILAWLSSSDRAALLDAARAKGEEEVKRWEDIYKPTPIVAPLNGFIIQRAVEPGQSISASDPILVMADYLIVKAQVDETDIGSIKIGQTVNIELDAYPGQPISGRVEHVAFESKTVSNVNIYEVDIVPGNVPGFFRAGMSATVNFVLQEKDNIMILPLNTVKKLGNKSYVFVVKEAGKKPESLQIATGLENSLHVEVVSGLAEGAEVVVPTIKMVEDLNSRSQRRRGPTNPLQRQNNN